MSDDDKLKPIRPDEAARQAREFFGVTAGVDFDLGNGKTWHLPNPNYLPRDMKRRYRNHLRFLNKELDTEQVTVTDRITGKSVKRTQTVVPWQYDGELIDEGELLCIALMGDDVEKDREAYFKEDKLPPVYEAFLAAGGVADQIQGHWNVMNIQLEERVKRDDKSN
jgi:hypothetical protein